MEQFTPYWFCMFYIKLHSLVVVFFLVVVFIVLSSSLLCRMIFHKYHAIFIYVEILFFSAHILIVAYTESIRLDQILRGYNRKILNIFIFSIYTNLSQDFDFLKIDFACLGLYVPTFMLRVRALRSKLFCGNVRGEAIWEKVLWHSTNTTQLEPRFKIKLP